MPSLLMQSLRLLLPCLLAGGAISQTPTTAPAPSPDAVATTSVSRLDGASRDERANALLRYVASITPAPQDESYPKHAVPAYVARLLLNVDTEYALARLDAAVRSRIELAQRDRLSDPKAPLKLDPFDKVALVNGYFLCRDQLPKATVERIRDYVALYAHRVWRGYGAMNYRLMMDGAGFLAAEEWPELIDQDGLNATQIREVTRSRLFGYFDEIAIRNYTEYGSPIYAAVNLSAVRMLAEYARDPEMRQRATLTLDAMLIDIACTWNRGMNIGSAGRAKYWGSTDTGLESMGATAAAAWVWFGAPRSISTGGIGWIHSFWMAAPGTYRLPEVVVALANARDEPMVHRSHIAGMPRQEVHRTTYHSLNYGLCSQWDKATSPADGLYKESRRHMLKWVSPRPSSTFAVCMENPRRPYNLKEGVANALGYGENPFSQYLQHEGTLLGVYAVPADFPYYKLYAPFTRRGAIVRRIERDGWVFCHNGSMLMAFRSAKPHTWSERPWSECDLLWVDARRNGWVLETSELGPFAGGGIDAELSRFADAVLARAGFDASRIDEPEPVLRYTSLTGHRLELRWVPHGRPYEDQSRIDGKPVDYRSWATQENRFVRQERGSPVLRIEIGKRRLTYDFSRWTREETIVP